MHKSLISLSFFLILQLTPLSGQVKIRLFSSYKPESAVITVTDGVYELDSFSEKSSTLINGDLVIISRYNGKLSVKPRNSNGFLCDSILLTGKTGKDAFSLRLNSNTPVRQNYSGDLRCLPDFGTLLFINTCNIEDYVSGVVTTEGGTGKRPEYFKTQAVIVRTYMYKYFDRHISDGYNLCDNTHCQAFNGLSTDTLVENATRQTKGLVILGPDSSLVISAFHSNCGGETAAAEDVWLSNQPYLKKVTDPYCLNSPNARWYRSISLNEWKAYMNRSGFAGKSDNPAIFSFSQSSRLADYRAGTFSLPLRQVRSDLNLRSTFFSLIVKGDSVILNGRGYGHGVGLCQEGAMVMAAKNFTFRQIISFYYTGVIIADIGNAVRK